MDTSETRRVLHRGRDGFAGCGHAAQSQRSASLESKTLRRVPNCMIRTALPATCTVFDYV